MLRARNVLPFLFLVGYSAATSPVDIPFELRFGNAPIGGTEAASGFTLTDLRFFVYEIELSGPDGPVPSS